MSQKYRYTVAFDFEVIDDVEARAVAGLLTVFSPGKKTIGFTKTNRKSEVDVSHKLQRVHQDKPPEKINL